MTAQELIRKMIGDARWDPYNTGVRDALDAAGCGQVAWVKMDGTTLKIYCFVRPTADKLAEWLHETFPTAVATTRNDGPAFDQGPHHYVEVNLI